MSNIIDRSARAVGLAIRLLEVQPSSRILIVTTMPHNFVKRLLQQFNDRIHDELHFSSWKVRHANDTITTPKGGFVKIMSLGVDGRETSKLLGYEVDQVYFEEAKLLESARMQVIARVRPRLR